MQTWWLNSKKCSTARSTRFLALSVVLFFLQSQQAPANAAPASQVSSSNQREIVQNVIKDIRRRNTASFEGLLSIWEKHYGTRAVAALLQVAQDRSLSDTDRYVAIMGVAKIGGSQSAPLLSPLLKDPSWMIRNAALRALTALGNPTTAPRVIPLISDAALVVRLEAVQSLEKLHPAGTEAALVAAIRAPENYHAGRAQWVPSRALEALRHLRIQNGLSDSEIHEASSKLTAFLEHPASYQRDNSLKPEIEATLRILNGN
jgi:HEAT repeat protein